MIIINFTLAESPIYVTEQWKCKNSSQYEEKNPTVIKKNLKKVKNYILYRTDL